MANISRLLLCMAVALTTAELVKRTATPAVFAHTASGGEFGLYRHTIALDRALTDCVSSGGRLIVTMPPRHGKSELCSKWLPVWYLGTFPKNQVLLCGHGADFARRFGRRDRALVRQHGWMFDIDLHPESKAAEEWSITGGGGLKTAGVGTGIVGLPANLLVIDDPIKGRDEARSETVRESVWEWFMTEAYTRLEPGASVVLFHTRWHEDDLAGRLLRGDAGGRWKELRLPAIAEDDDPVGRRRGDALWPERYPLEGDGGLFEIKDAQSPYWWSALYQQRPTPEEGGMFKREWFVPCSLRDVPKDARFVRWWDKAATEKGGDWTAGVLLALKGDDLWIVDVIRGQWGSGRRDDLIDLAAADDEATWGSVEIWFEQEPGSGGKQSAEISAKRLSGYRVKYEPSTGSKEDRADALASHCWNRWKAASPARIVSGQWTRAFLDELCLFPNGTHDDQVDAASGAFNKLAKPKKKLIFSTGAKA
jgi:predicted phage terminase large subunit-like protein